MKTRCTRTLEIRKDLYKEWDIWAATWQNLQNDCAPYEDSDQPGHPPCLIRVFAVCMKKAWVLGYPLNVHSEDWSDWADAQADLSLRWAHSHFVCFVMSRLIWVHNRLALLSINMQYVDQDAHHVCWQTLYVNWDAVSLIKIHQRMYVDWSMFLDWHMQYIRATEIFKSKIGRQS